MVKPLVIPRLMCCQRCPSGPVAATAASLPSEVDGRSAAAPGSGRGIREITSASDEISTLREDLTTASSSPRESRISSMSVVKEDRTESTGALTVLICLPVSVTNFWTASSVSFL